MNSRGRVWFRGVNRRYFVWYPTQTRTLVTAPTFCVPGFDWRTNQFVNTGDQSRTCLMMSDIGSTVITRVLQRMIRMNLLEVPYRFNLVLTKRISNMAGEEFDKQHCQQIT